MYTHIWKLFKRYINFNDFKNVFLFLGKMLVSFYWLIEIYNNIIDVFIIFEGNDKKNKFYFLYFDCRRKVF